MTGKKTRLTGLAAVFLLHAALSTAEDATLSPKPICERTHSDVLRYLSTAKLKQARDERDPYFIADQEAERKKGNVTLSEIQAALKTGLYTRDENSTAGESFTDLVPYFQMGMGNTSGWFYVGICWWHSRYQRATAYLVSFAPEKEKPSSAEAKKIMRDLTRFRPVTIPGFRSLSGFHAMFAKELEDVLSEWQARTTASRPGPFVRATYLTVVSSDSAREELNRKTFDQLISSFDTAPKPTLLVIETHPVSAHSFLIIGSERDADGKTTFRFLDSNQDSMGRPGEWKIGTADDMDLRYPAIRNFKDDSAYGNMSFKSFQTAFSDDFESIEKGLQTECGKDYRIKP